MQIRLTDNIEKKCRISSSRFCCRWLPERCLIIILLLLFGCALSEPNTKLPGYHFVRATYESPLNLDPVSALSEAQAAIITQVYDGLTRVNEALEIEPNLAESWSVENGGTRYVFDLR